MASSPRLRIFAGPNGSGKSIMKRQVEGTIVHGRPLNLGAYINADEIARALRKESKFDLSLFDVEVSRPILRKFAIGSGLFKGLFRMDLWQRDHHLEGSSYIIRYAGRVEYHAQLLASFLCQSLLAAGRSFSFETVFSHESKVELMRKANRAGYKVYLYFIATNAPEINVDRVKTRVQSGGHAVPEEKITERYWKSLDQLTPGIAACYHAFVFDNTPTLIQGEGEPQLFAEMKRADHGLGWAWVIDHIPDWFIRAYLNTQEESVYWDVARRALESRSVSK